MLRVRYLECPKCGRKGQDIRDDSEPYPRPGEEKPVCPLCKVTMGVVSAPRPKFETKAL